MTDKAKPEFSEIRLSTNAEKLGLGDALAKQTDGSSKVMLQVGMDLLQKTKLREQLLSSVLFKATVTGMQRFHNQDPNAVIAYVNDELRKAGFNLKVSIE